MSDSTQSVKKTFDSKREVEHYAKIIKHGLLETEKYVIDKYFKSKEKILDLGCGAGREAFVLAKRGFEIIGVDIAPNMIKYANEYAKKHKISNTKFIAKNITKLNYPENSFDYIMLPTQTIEHIKGINNRIKLLKQCKNFLKPKGVMFFTTHERKSGFKFWWFWTKKEIGAIFKKPDEELGDTWIEANNPETKMQEKMFLHFYTKKEALSEIKSAGLNLIEVVKSTDFEEKDWVGKSLKYTFVCGGK
ncbi:MAG: methyltransferase domain-containing protein [Nanoarchaeota archaeon]|nr:methyltransferase domain-containing protein [Nanoarchaeota archaeon]